MKIGQKRHLFAGERRQFCVFTSVGDNNHVLSWLQDNGERNWDLIIAFYGESEEIFNALAMHAHVIFKMKGSKFQNLKKIYLAQPGLLNHYKYIWVADDDLTFVTGNIGKLFDFAARFGFIVSQPAFSKDGRVSHPITAVGHGRTIARIVNFIEVTCPLFQTKHLFEFLDTYDGNLVGWGVDWWFCCHLGSETSKQFAIIDEVQVLNPHDYQKKSGAREINKLLGVEDRVSQWNDTKHRYNLVEFPQEVFADISAHKIIDFGIKQNLSPRELEFFKFFLNRAKNYIEFGSGDSVCLACNIVTDSVISIDSSIPLIDRIEKYFFEHVPKIAPNLIAVDIGPVDIWGYPVNQDHRDQWPSYHNRIWEIPQSKKADLVLIVGRFRVACFMHVILNCGPGTIIFFSNFAARKEYHIILEVAREIALIENLSVFLPLEGSSKQRAAEILKEYMFVPL